MTATPLTFQEAWIADLKAQAVFSSGTFPTEIREIEWQGTDFVYPNIRVGLDFMPSINGCGPDDADVYIQVYAEDKSSKLCSTIASQIFSMYHKKPFINNGIQFSTVVVRKVSKPTRSIYAWMSEVHIFCQGA